MAENAIKLEIQAAYLDHLLNTGSEPLTIPLFASEVGITEEDFYSCYRSFKSVEKDAWLEMLLNAQRALEADSEFPMYSAQEKVLSLFYTLIEVNKQYRSLILFRAGELKRTEISPWYMQKFKDEFLSMISIVLNEGIDNQEILSRPVIGDKYKDAFWIQYLYILRVWINDESEEYQITDAAVEKSVNLTFELLKKGPLDMMIDFVKFAYQNKAY